MRVGLLDASMDIDWDDRTVATLRLRKLRPSRRRGPGRSVVLIVAGLRVWSASPLVRAVAAMSACVLHAADDHRPHEPLSRLRPRRAQPGGRRRLRTTPGTSGPAHPSPAAHDARRVGRRLDRDTHVVDAFPRKRGAGCSGAPDVERCSDPEPGSRPGADERARHTPMAG